MPNVLMIIVSTPTPTGSVGPLPRFLVTKSPLLGPFPRRTCSVSPVPAAGSLHTLRLMYCVAAATIDYLDSGKVKTKGIVNKTFKLEDFDKALQSIKDKTAIKAAIVFE